MKKNSLNVKYTGLAILTAVLSQTSSASDQLLYAPRQKIIQGTKSLTCIGIHYQNMTRYASASECKTLAQGVSDFYYRNSRNLLNLIPYGYSENVALDGNSGNYLQARDSVIAQHPGSDYYAVVGIFTPNHSGGGISNLVGTLLSTATHEVGHLLGLGHSGAYQVQADGTVTFDPYGDGTSVMSAYPSGNLTAPQYYSRGWLYDNEAAIYEPGKTYDLRKINDFTTSGLATVIVPPAYYFNAIPSATDATNIWSASQRPLFISFSPGCNNSDSCVAIHLATSQGAGSQRIKLFGNEYYDQQFTGIHVKVLGLSQGKLTISVDFQPKPASLTQSLFGAISPISDDDSSLISDDSSLLPN